MFDLAITPEQENIREQVRTLAPELRRLGAAAELERKPSTELIDSILAGAYDIPRTDDGRLDPLGAVIAAAEYGHADPGVGFAVVGSWQARLLLGDSPEPGAGELESALLYEGFGRAPSEFTTTATLSGDGWTLVGRKEGVLHPGKALVSAVLAREFGSGDLAVFRVSGTPDGLVVDRDDSGEGKLGLRAAHTGAVGLDGVLVAPEARVPHTGDLARTVALARLLVAGVALGGARASLDYAVDWAKTRTAFGKPIATYQGVAFVLADLDTAIESARLLLWDTVTGLDRFDSEPELERAVSRVVARVGAVATDAGREGVNILGVHGIVTDHPVERWYRAAAALSVLDFDPLAVALPVA